MNQAYHKAFLNLKNIKFIFGGACTSKINGNLDEKVYVDLTAVQFFPQWQAVVGTKQEFEDMGHEMGIEQET